MDERLVFNQEIRVLWNSEPQGPLATLANPLSGSFIEVDDAALLDLCEYASTPRSRDDLVGHLTNGSRIAAG